MFPPIFATTKPVEEADAEGNEGNHTQHEERSGHELSPARKYVPPMKSSQMVIPAIPTLSEKLSSPTAWPKTNAATA